MDAIVKILVVVLMALFVYREIIKATSVRKQPVASDTKVSLLSFVGFIALLGGFVYFGMFITLIETRDLRPYHKTSIVSIYDKGVIQVGDIAVQTNLAKKKELELLAYDLTSMCKGSDGCEAQKLLDFVTRIPYKTDLTSRNAKEVILSNWGDCDDKSNLFASLLTERGIDYKFVYVEQHVFVVVHVDDTSNLSTLRSRLLIDNKNYYYAETTATNSKLGEHNGQFPYNFIGIYDMKHDVEIDMNEVSFKIG